MIKSSFFRQNQVIGSDGSWRWRLPATASFSFGGQKTEDSAGNNKDWALPVFSSVTQRLLSLPICLTLYIYRRFCARLANSRCAAASVQDVSSQASQHCRPLSLVLFLFSHTSISFSHIFNHLLFFLMWVSTLFWSLPSLFRIDRLAIIPDIYQVFYSFLFFALIRCQIYILQKRRKKERKKGLFVTLGSLVLICRRCPSD